MSFFKPTTRHAKVNRNVIIMFICVWAIAVFGFHILLRIVEKPTPEKALTEFESVWGNVKSDNASEEQICTYSQSLLSCLGKSSLSAEHRAILQNAFSAVVYNTYPDTLKADLYAEVEALQGKKKAITRFNEPAYLQAKKSIAQKVAPLIGVTPNTVYFELIPLEISTDMKAFTTKESVHKVMKLYMTHNQSFLTDATFLGFPFHYFYSAVFLLILFVGLCWLYCVIIDRLD